MNAPSTKINNDALINNIKPITTNDTLTLSHNNVICPNTFTTNTIAGTPTTINGVATSSNLTIAHPKVIIGNKLNVTSINPVLDTDNLPITHPFVNINQVLKVDQINSILTSTITEQTTLTFGHDNVSIPINLKTDRIKPCFVPPVTNPVTETSLIISHDNTTISKKLKVNSIYSLATTDTISLNANAVTISNNLNVDNIVSTGLALNVVTTATNGVIYIGNKEYPNKCDIYFYGKVHHIVNTPNDGLIDELEGFINQIGI